MQIETTRILLRPFVKSDAVAAAYNSKTPTVAHFMPDMVLPSEPDALQWIDWLGVRRNDHAPCRVLAIERKDSRTVIGLIGIAPKQELNGEIEILFSIADTHQNRGYATEAARAMLWWAFEKARQEVICAIVKPCNKASRRVIEKLGFVYVDTRVLPHDEADCAFDYFRLYRTDPLPGPEWDIQTQYRPEPMAAFFDARAEGYNDHMLRDGGVEDYKKLGDSFPKTDEKLEILDIGCGTGIELDYIWARVPRAHITCLELSRAMLELLRKNHPHRRHQISIIEASYTDWAYPAAAFDMAVSSMTLHHLRQEEKTAVYRSVLRTLKPGGVYIESDFMVNAVLAEQYRRRYEQITGALPEKAGAGEYHIDIPLTVEAQRSLLLDAGFRNVEILSDKINHGNGAILRAGK